MSTTAVIIDICRSRGDTFPIPFTAVDSDGAIIDLTGGSLLMTVDPEPDPITSANNLFQLTGAIVDAVSGTFTMPISVVQADQTPDTYFHDIQLTDGAGDIRTIFKGEFQFVQDITK